MSAGFYAVADRLAALKQQDLYRQARVLQGPQAPMVSVEGRPLINFCSNDYLGLSQHPQVIAAFKQAANDYGVGSGSAHLVCGHSTPHVALEEALAAFTQRDRAVLFSTGYMANLGVITALVGRGDWVLQDRLNHASLLDGGMLSGARLQRYRHGDMVDLQAKLAGCDKRCLLVSDGVFSMEGDCAPLVALAAIAENQQAGLLIDDAHGIGVLGVNGGGLVEACGLTQQQVPLLMGTFGKALGSFGAFVAGPADVMEYLVQSARSYIYTTAMPPALAEATRVSLQVLQNESWRRQHLQALIVRFRAAALQLGLSVLPSQTAIQPVLLGESAAALRGSQQLWDKGFWVSAIRPPTVPHGSARLRITLSAAHQPHQVDALLEALSEVLA